MWKPIVKTASKLLSLGKVWNNDFLFFPGSSRIRLSHLVRIRRRCVFRLFFVLFSSTFLPRTVFAIKGPQQTWDAWINWLSFRLSGYF